jgi:hypothetical protein
MAALQQFNNEVYSTGVVIQPEVSSLRVMGSTPTQWTRLTM